MSVGELYASQVKRLSAKDRLQLARWILDDLVDDRRSTPSSEVAGRRSLMELHGLGKEIWQDIDVDAYLTQMRDEWDET